MKKYFLIFIIIELITINVCNAEENSHLLPEFEYPGQMYEYQYPAVTVTPAPPPDGYPYYSNILGAYTDIPFP